VIEAARRARASILDDLRARLGAERVEAAEELLREVLRETGADAAVSARRVRLPRLNGGWVGRRSTPGGARLERECSMHAHDRPTPSMPPFARYTAQGGVIGPPSTVAPAADRQRDHGLEGVGARVGRS
jgi:hypothetical protein